MKGVIGETQQKNTTTGRALSGKDQGWVAGTLAPATAVDRMVTVKGIAAVNPTNTKAGETSASF